MDYRREIDGLRALAVLPVMLFHAGFETFSGGFVGVDVFFVISGYLITTIILAELERGSFSIVDFYERRARRILPALFLVMVVCIPFAWFWLLPSDMKDFSQSLVAVSVFASNILFWRESGYFDTAAELKPLLHTWSLAVEEQYYVLFPLFLMLTWRFGKRWIAFSLPVAAIISLSLAQWGSRTQPAATFYLLPTRGWELLIGAIAAFYLSKENRTEFSKGLREAGGALGLALIVYSVFAYDKQTPTPGLYALAPTVGAVLIILLSTQQTAIGKFVGNKVLVGIGLISYSAYLWHQPLYAFARHRSLNEPSELVFAFLAGSSLVLAYLSWKYVEGPFRNKSVVTRRQILFVSIFFSTLFVLFGLAGQFTNGTYLTNLVKIASIDSRVVVNHGLSSDCDGDFTNSVNCTTSAEPEVLVWGDSYAMHLVQGLRSSNDDMKLVQKTVSMCGPFLDISPINTKYVRAWSEKCMKANDQVFHFITTSPSIKYIVMSSHFRQYVGSGATVLTRTGEVVRGDDVAYDAMFNTVSRIKDLGKVPVIFSPTPQNGQNIGRCLMKAAMFEKSYGSCDVKLASSYSTQGAVYEFLKRVEKVNPVVWLSDGLCVDGVCKSSFDGTFVYRDGEHLSYEGSAYLGKKMRFYQLLESFSSITR